MNILLVNYGHAENNSAYHILGFAHGLSALGHDVVVAVSKCAAEEDFREQNGIRIACHRSVLAKGGSFRDGQEADILHVWTPRETMRTFAESYLGTWGARALLIHLEDNEESIFERFTGCTVAEGIGMQREWSKGLIHPAHFRKFMNRAQGITLVHRCLEPLSPAHLPCQEIVPVIDPTFFKPARRDECLATQLGIRRGARVIAYNGNDHAAAAQDIRLLYEAVDILIERGWDIYLVRTGHVLPTSYDGVQFRPGPRCIELGFIDRKLIPAIMQLADLFFQPGDPDAFNAYRLPAKVPEYLSLGIPLIVGSGNISRELALHSAAVILPRTTVPAVVQAVEWQFNHPKESAAIGARGLSFARQRFSEANVIPILEDFYSQILIREMSSHSESAYATAAIIS